MLGWLAYRKIRSSAEIFGHIVMIFRPVLKSTSTFFTRNAIDKLRDKLYRILDEHFRYSVKCKIFYNTYFIPNFGH